MFTDKDPVKTAKKPVKKAPEAPQTYTNTSKKNIFTERGRVVPGDTVQLLPGEAKVYKGLTQK